MAKTVGVFIVLWGVVLCLHAVPRRRFCGVAHLARDVGAVGDARLHPHHGAVVHPRRAVSPGVAMWLAFNGLGIILGGAIVAWPRTPRCTRWRPEMVFVVTGRFISLGSVIVHVPDLLPDGVVHAAPAPLAVKRARAKTTAGLRPLQKICSLSRRSSSTTRLGFWCCLGC